MILGSNLRSKNLSNLNKMCIFASLGWNYALGMLLASNLESFRCPQAPKLVDFGSKNVKNLKIFARVSMRKPKPSEQLVLMIRATSSRSTRPNHMSNPIDSPKAPRLADFGRVAADLHSVAKQTPFRVAFRVHFGGQKPPKIDEISSF